MKSKKAEIPLQEIVDRQVESREARAIMQEDIARRAYFLYLTRGREDGHDIDDWLRAKQELLNASLQPEQDRKDAA